MDCIICAESIDGEARLHAFGQCNHRGVCSICFLRIRSLLNENSCPICKTTLDTVIATPADETLFQNYSIWGTNAGPEFSYDDKSRMFFPKSYYKTQVHGLWVSKCPMCDVVKRDCKALRKHLIAEHDHHMCTLCIDHKNAFPSEQRIYTPAAYETHLKKGDGDGSEGHPFCEFCKTRFYDKTMLFMHLQKEHYSCHICDKNGVRYKYYKDYHCLEAHFRKDHYLCEDHGCLQKRFVVFSNNIDYTAHVMSYHPHMQVNRTIPLEFQRYNVSESRAANDSRHDFSSRRHDGGVSGRDVNGEWQVELPPSARDPREVLRETQGSEEEVAAVTAAAMHASIHDTEAYPALSAGVSARSADWVGGRLAADNFPTLSNPAPSGINALGQWARIKKPSKGVTIKTNKANVARLKADIESLTAPKPQPKPQSRPEPKPTPAPPPAQAETVAPPRPPTLADKLRSERSEQSPVYMTSTTKSSPEPSSTTQSEPTIAQLLFQRQQRKSQTQTSSPPLPTPPPALAIVIDGPTPKEAASNVASSNTIPKPQKKSKPTASKDWVDAFQSSGLKVDKKQPVGISIVKMKSKPEEPSRPVYTPPASLPSPPPGFDNMRPVGKKQRDAELETVVPPGFGPTPIQAYAPAEPSPMRAKQNTAPTPNDPNVKLVDRSRSGWVSIGGANESSEKPKTVPSKIGDTDYPQLTSVYQAEKPVAGNKIDTTESVWTAKPKPKGTVDSSVGKKQKKKQANELMKLAFK